MGNKNIGTIWLVKMIQQLVDECGGQRAAARKLGNINLQTAIRDAINGVRTPSKALVEAFDEYNWRRIEETGIAEGNELALIMRLSKKTKNTIRFDVVGDVGIAYFAKTAFGRAVPHEIEVVLR